MSFAGIVRAFFANSVLKGPLAADKTGCRDWDERAHAFTWFRENGNSKAQEQLVKNYESFMAMGMGRKKGNGDYDQGVFRTWEWVTE